MPAVNSGVLDGVRRIGGRFRDLAVDGGIPGAPLGFRLRGATKSGPPATGTWRPGDTVTDRAGVVWTCTTGGTPGQWAATVAALAPSGDVTGAKDAAAVNTAVAALGTDGGTVRLLPGNWYLVPGAVVIKPSNSQAIVIDGQWGAVVNAVSGVAGDVIRMYNPASQSGNYNGNAFSVRSGVRGITIDGTSATAGSTGLHIGDLMNPQLDVSIQNFSGAGDIGLHLDNTVSWTEQAAIRDNLINNTSNVVFETSGTGAVSFGYGIFDFGLEQAPGQDGVVVKNGAQIYSSHLKIRGGAGASSTFASNAVLRITGVAPAGTDSPGAVSNVWATVIDIDVECNFGPGGVTAGPYTVFIDSVSGCYLSNCTGQLNFLSNNGTFHATNATNANNFQFFGQVLGDTVIQTSVVGWPFLFESPVGIGNWGATQTLSNSSTITLTGGNVIPVTSSAAVTGVIMSGGSFDGQIISVYNSGSYPVTFAASGTSAMASGTVEVIWPGAMRLYMWSGNQDVWYPADGTTANAQPDAEQFMALTTTYTLASGTTLQKLFNATTNGALTVAAAATYFFECSFDLSAMATTTSTGNFSFGFGGTATLTSIRYTAYAQKSAAVGTPATAQVTVGTAATATALVSGSTTATGSAFITGTVRVNAAGTLIPEVALNVSTTTAVVAANARFRIWPVGSNTVTSTGNWS